MSLFMSFSSSLLKFISYSILHYSAMKFMHMWIRSNRKHILIAPEAEMKVSKETDQKNITDEGADNVAVKCSDCEMSNSAPRVDRHVILCQEGSWPSHLEKVEGSVAHKLKKLLKNVETQLHIKLTACDEPVVDANGVRNANAVDILVYPEGIRYSIFKNQLQSFVDCIVSPDHVAAASQIGLRNSPVGWAKVIFVCTHGARDKRCGRAGPQIIEAIRQELSVRGIPESEIAVRGSSHIGGHKYAGTLIVYPAGQWYGLISARMVPILIDAVMSDRVLDKYSRGCSKVVDW